MTQQHPITPPPSELVLQWIGEFFGCTAGGELSDSERFLTTRAAQWGADQELEACCEWINSFQNKFVHAHDLRLVRRPKPSSLKKQALKALENLNGECLLEGFECSEKVATIRRALEQLSDNEPSGNSR